MIKKRKKKERNLNCPKFKIHECIFVCYVVQNDTSAIYGIMSVNVIQKKMERENFEKKKVRGGVGHT